LLFYIRNCLVTNNYLGTPPLISKTRIPNPTLKADVVSQQVHVKSPLPLPSKKQENVFFYETLFISKKKKEMVQMKIINVLNP